MFVTIISTSLLLSFGTYMRDLSLKTLSHSFSSSSIFKTISVPLPNVFPRGSGKIWNSSPEEVETNVFCSGFGLSAVGGGKEDTWTVFDTKKLGISFDHHPEGEMRLANCRNRDLGVSSL